MSYYTISVFVTSIVSHFVDSKPLVNAALFKPAYQSSSYAGWVTADLGNNGKRTQDPVNYECTHTQTEYPGWWMVDLQGWYLVNYIIFSNR